MQLQKLTILKGYDVSKEEFLKANRNNELVRLGIHVTSTGCNLRCPYCLNAEGMHYIDNKLLEGRASVNEIKGWIDQAKELNVRYVIIDGIYEPLLNVNDTLEILSYVRKNNITPMLITNTLLLKEDTVKELARLKVSILGKLNVPLVDKENEKYDLFASIQNELTGCAYSDTYERLRKSIELLIKYGFNKKDYNDQGNLITRLGLETVVTPQNYEYIPDLAKQLRSLNIYMHAEMIKPQGGVKDDSFAISSSKVEALCNKVKENDRQMGIDSGELTPAYITGKCLSHMGSFNINISGDVIPCPSVEVIVGNLREQKMKDIIENSPEIKILRNLQENIKGDCKNCKLMKNQDCYGGCRGYTYMFMRQKGYSKEEALAASDPSCWRVHNIL